MTPETYIESPPDRPTWAAQFHTRLTRYRSLLARWWWMPLLLVLLAVGVQAALIYFAPPVYFSIGRMIVSVRLTIPDASVYTEELSNFLGTQAALMQSPEVSRRAHARVTAQKPDLPPQPIDLKVTVMPKTSIFVLRATGDDPDYTRAYLEACMDEYIKLKKEMRNQTSDTTLAGLTEEVLRFEKELRKCDEEMVAFASTNSVVLLQEQGNNAGTYLATLNQRLAALRFEHELLKALTLDQNLERRDRRADTLPGLDPVADTSFASSRIAADTEYLRAKQAITLLKAELQELGEYLKPQHPKMVALSEDIARRERLLETYRQQSVEELESKKSALAIQIEKLEQEVKEWDAKVLEISRKTAEYQKLRANSQRIQALYDRLLATMQTLDVNKEISPESVTIMERASAAEPDRPKLTVRLPLAGLIGLALSFALLMLIDRLDDRMHSLTELAQLFDETVLAQVPLERAGAKNGTLQLVHPEDERHGFVEAYRSIRSSLLYMSESGPPPKTILVTSSDPNDGKSLTAANLAITLANAGSRVLLVDADLRKGVLHERFGLAAQPGLSEALSNGTDWTRVVVPTSVANLSFLPRGAASHKTSELFLSTAAQKFFKEVGTNYDFVLLDSSPVMATDDVTTLAPHMDGVLFVIRAGHTSARVARAALELLERRRARILGLIFNAVHARSGDYYYYYRYRDYYKYHPSE